MAYIGRDIEYGSFTKQTLTADSSTLVFTLDQSVLDAKSLLVSVGGVIQEPDVAYTASGTTLTFTGTPVTGDPIWIVYLGKTLGLSSEREAVTYQTATGDGSATTVAMTSTGTTGTIIVTLNGVMQTPSTDFSVSGSTLTFTTAPFSGAAIGIYYVGKKAKLGVPAADSIVAGDLAAGGTFPAWDGSALTGITSVMKSDIFEMQNNIALLNFLRSNDSTTKRLSMLNGFNDMFRNTTGVVGEGVSVPMTRFDGTSDTLTVSNATLGQSDGKSFIISAYMQFDTDGVQSNLCANNANRFHIFRNTDNEIQVSFYNSSGTQIASVKSTNTITVSDGIVHVLIGVDMTNTTIEILFDGVLETNQVVVAPANDTIDHTVTNFYISKPGLTYKGSLGQVGIWEEYLDFSVAGNIAKFYNNGPVDMGADGSTPTGTQPRVFLNNSFGTFQNNLGSGGNFTEGGALVDGGYVTDKTYSSNSFTNSYDLVDSNGKEKGLYNSNLGQNGGGFAQSIAQVLTITETWSVKRIAFSMKSKTSTVPADLIVPFISGVDTTAGDVGGPGGLGTGADGDDNIIALGTGRSFNSSTISSSAYEVKYFDFPEPVTLPAGSYAFGLQTSMFETANYLRAHIGDPEHHSGNSAIRTASAWIGGNAHDYDYVFYIYGEKNLDLITKGTDALTTVDSPASAPTKGHIEAIVDESPASGTSVWTANNTLDSNGWTGISIRQIILGSDISAGGDKIRITLQGNSANTGEYDNVSIVERSGTSSGTTTPTEILFGGASGIAIPSSNGTVVSDWFDYTIDASKSYLICMDVISDAAKDDFVINVSTGAGYYWSLNTNSYNTTSLGGSITFVPNRTHTISKIETSVKPTINTDIIGEISRDGGTTYSPAVLSRIPKVINGSSYEILAGDVDFTGDPSGTNLVGRIRTVNKHKVTVNGIAVNWI